VTSLFLWGYVKDIVYKTSVTSLFLQGHVKDIVKRPLWPPSSYEDTWRTLFTRSLWPPSSCGDTLRTLFTRPLSSCGDKLRTLFTRPCDLPSWAETQNCCCDRNSYTANAEEHLAGNWIQLGRLTCQEKCACRCCLAFCRINSTCNKTLQLHFNIP
jgi:hypothetical protein